MKTICRDDGDDGDDGGDDDDIERHCIPLACWVRILDDRHGCAAGAEDRACRSQRGSECCPSCWHVRIWRIKPHCCSDRIRERGHCVLHGTWWTSSDVIRRSCFSDSHNVITNGTRNVAIRNVHHIRR